MKGAVLSLGILVGSVVVWCGCWGVVIGFGILRHEPLLWLPTVGLMGFSLTQFLLDSVSPADGTDRAALEHLSAMAASVLLAISILAAMPVVSRNTVPVLQTRFHWASLVSFLWIVLGVFGTLGLEASQRGSPLFRALLRGMRVASLGQALCWASAAALLLVAAIQQMR